MNYADITRVKDILLNSLILQEHMAKSIFTGFKVIACNNTIKENFNNECKIYCLVSAICM